jgi:hypothetical protein
LEIPRMETTMASSTLMMTMVAMKDLARRPE